MEEEQHSPLSPSKTGNKRVRRPKRHYRARGGESDNDYEPGAESDQSDDEYCSAQKGYSVPSGKENSPRRSRKKRKSVGENSNNGRIKEPAGAGPRHQLAPFRDDDVVFSPEARRNLHFYEDDDDDDDNVVSSLVARAQPQLHDGKRTLPQALSPLASDGDEKKPAARTKKKVTKSTARTKEKVTKPAAPATKKKGPKSTAHTKKKKGSRATRAKKPKAPSYITVASDLKETVSCVPAALEMINDYLAECTDSAVKASLTETVSTLQECNGQAEECLGNLEDASDKKQWVTDALEHDATLDCLNLQVHQIVEWLQKTNLELLTKVPTYKLLVAHLEELLASDEMPDQLALHSTLAYFFAIVKGYNACAFNFGQIVTELTKSIMLLHYAPTSDKGTRQLAMTGFLHTMDDKNCCLHTAQDLFLVLSAERVVRSHDCNDGVEDWRIDEEYNAIKHKAAEDESFVAMDYSTITCQKGKEKQQLEAFREKVGMCAVKYDNLVGLLLVVIGKIVSANRVAQNLEPRVPAIAFGVNPREFAKKHEKKRKKGDCLSFQNTTTEEACWANHPQSYWLSKNNKTMLKWDNATLMDGNLTDSFCQTFGDSPIYKLAPCNIFRGCVGAHTKAESDLARQRRVTEFLDRMNSWKACGKIRGDGQDGRGMECHVHQGTYEDWCQRLAFPCGASQSGWYSSGRMDETVQRRTEKCGGGANVHLETLW